MAAFLICTVHKKEESCGETKGWEDRAEKQRQQVSTNGQWHVSAGARLSTGAWTAEIFTRRTELIHFKSVWAERERERTRPISYLLAELRQQRKQLNGQQCMNNVHVWLFYFTNSFLPWWTFPSALFTGLTMTKTLKKCTCSNLLCLIQPRFICPAREV